MRRRDDHGVAALELALLLTLLTALLALVAPLAYLFYERIQLGRASGDVVRFATSRSDKVREATGPLGTFSVPADDLPSDAAIWAEVADAYDGSGTLTTTPATIVRTADNDCPSGFRKTITITTTVDVSPFIGLLITTPTKTLSATASSCEE